MVGVSRSISVEGCVSQQARVEQEEEFISNKLLKRLEQLKQEKQALANEVGSVRCISQ